MLNPHPVLKPLQMKDTLEEVVVEENIVVENNAEELYVEKMLCPEKEVDSCHFFFFSRCMHTPSAGEKASGLEGLSCLS